MFQNDRKCFSHSNTQSISAGWCFYLQRVCVLRQGDNDVDDDGCDCDRDGAVAVAPDDWDGDSGDADSRSEGGPVAASQPGWASQSPPYQSTQSLEIERRSLTIMFLEIIVFHVADEVRAKTFNIWS